MTTLDIFRSSAETIKNSEILVDEIDFAATKIWDTIQRGDKILVCGNGGSAADAQHFSAELLCRFERERQPLAAITLTADTSTLTAIGNDYSFDDIFAKQIIALGRSEDTLLAITTSGNSANIAKAVAVALDGGLNVIVLTGRGGGTIKKLFENHPRCQLIVVPSSITARIQEVHQVIVHAFCSAIDKFYVGESQ